MPVETALPPPPTTAPAPPIDMHELTDAVKRAGDALRGRQAGDGHWVFELEADATIPAEYVLLEHYLGRIEPELQNKIGVYLRAIQGSHGGWPLFHDGAFDISASVKAYYALKAIGDDPDAPHMVRAREAILAHGGAERSNVFTRAQLALFKQVPWRAVPVMPVEIMLLPRWFPFHLSKIWYWSRTVLVPLLVLMALKPCARNPRGVTCQELFRTPPERIRHWITGPYRSRWGRFFKSVDAALRTVEPRLRPQRRQKAIERARRFVIERLNGEDGLGAIYPAMGNAVMMLDTLGVPPDDPDAAIAWASVRKLLVIGPDRAYCQPCLSPIWDTSLAGHAVAEADGAAGPSLDAACAWLEARQVNDVAGDWADVRPGTPPGGWAFQSTTRTTRTWMIPPSSPCCCIGTAIRRMLDRSRGRGPGSSACRAAMAAGAHSTRTTTTTTLTTSRLRITGRCSILRPPTSPPGASLPGPARPPRGRACH